MIRSRAHSLKHEPETFQVSTCHAQADGSRPCPAAPSSERSSCRSCGDRCYVPEGPASPRSIPRHTCSSAGPSGLRDDHVSSSPLPQFSQSATPSMCQQRNSNGQRKNTGNQCCRAAALSASWSSCRYLGVIQTSRTNWFSHYLASAACRRTKCNLDAVSRRLHPPA